MPPTLSQAAHTVLGGPQTWLPVATGAAHFLLNLGAGVAILLVTFWLAKWASGLARDAMGRLHSRAPDAVLQGFVASLVRYGIVIIGLIAMLQQIGVQTTSVLAVLGAASLAIGLALQGGLSNVAAGAMLLLLRPYRIGDRVQIAGTQGRVRAMDLFVTRLHDPDNSVVFVPNSKAFGDIIINYSMPDSRRIVMEFGIDYDDDVDLALSLLIEAAEADPRIVAEPAPWAKLTELGESTVTVTLRAWTSSDGYVDTRFDLIKHIKAKFEAAGLSFAYPHQVAVERRPWTPPDRQQQVCARKTPRETPRRDVALTEQAPTSALDRRERSSGSVSETN